MSAIIPTGSVNPRPARWDGLALAHTLWLILLVALVVKLLISPYRGHLYGGYAQTARELAGGVESPESCYSWQHLPHFADLLYPFSLLPDRCGAILWLLLSVGILLTGLRAFVLRFAEPALHRSFLVTAYFVVAVVGLGSLGNSQSNILILGCLLWGTVAVANGWWWTAALCLAVPTFKLYPIALGLVYVALYPRKFALRFAVAVALCCALPFLLHPSHIVSTRYLEVFDYLLSGDHYTDYAFVNVRDALSAYGLSLRPRYFLPIQVTTGAGIVGLLWRQRWYGVGESEIIRTGCLLTSFWFVTFGPSVEWQTYLLVGPALAWLTATVWRSGRVTVLGVVSILVVVFVGPMQTSLFGVVAQRAVVGSKLSCWILLAMALWQVRLAWSAGTSRQDGRSQLAHDDRNPLAA